MLKPIAAHTNTERSGDTTTLDMMIVGIATTETNGDKTATTMAGVTTTVEMSRQTGRDTEGRFQRNTDVVPKRLKAPSKVRRAALPRVGPQAGTEKSAAEPPSVRPAWGC